MLIPKWYRYFIEMWVEIKNQTQPQGVECNNSCSLHWRHNDHDSVSNHQPHDCLLNRLFRRRSKKTSKLRVTGLCAGNSPGPVNSPHKGPVTREKFPFDDVIMWLLRRTALNGMQIFIIDIILEWKSSIELQTFDISLDILFNNWGPTYDNLWPSIINSRLPVI